MFILLLIWAVMATAAAVCGLQMGQWPALALWSAIAAVACALGAVLLARQPLGVSTVPGRFGGAIVRWGYRVGGGRLQFAVVISWVVWLLLGAAVIGAVRHRSQPRYLLMILAWVVDGIALLYVLGSLLMMGRSARSLLTIVLLLLGMLAVSAALWFIGRSDKARSLALMLAGGPPLVLGGAYGLFLLVILSAGKKTRWN